MTNILHIDSSSDTAASSHSRRLTAELVQKLQGKHSGAGVTRRDVVADALPHVGIALRGSWSTDAGGRTPDQVEAVTRSEGLIGELKAADIVVIGSPMYNFTVPSTLKAWIDHVAVAGQTFRYTENGPEGLLTGKRAYLVLSSGGVYSEGPAAPMDHLGTYLLTVLRFMGMRDVEIVRAEGTAMGPDKEAAAMEGASARIDELVAAGG